MNDLSTDAESVDPAREPVTLGSALDREAAERARRAAEAPSRLRLIDAGRRAVMSGVEGLYVYRAASGLSHIVEPGAVTTSCGRDLDASEVAIPVVQGELCEDCGALDPAREPVSIGSVLDEFFAQRQVSA